MDLPTLCNFHLFTAAEGVRRSMVRTSSCPTSSHQIHEKSAGKNGRSCSSVTCSWRWRGNSYRWRFVTFITAQVMFITAITIIAVIIAVSDKIIIILSLTSSFFNLQLKYMISLIRIHFYLYYNYKLSYGNCRLLVINHYIKMTN